MSARRFLDGDPTPGEEVWIYTGLAVIVVALHMARHCIPHDYGQPAERATPPTTPPESLYQPKESAP